MKTQTIIYDDNGGFVAEYGGTCAVSPDGSIWRTDVDDTGNPTYVKVA